MPKPTKEGISKKLALGEKLTAEENAFLRANRSKRKPAPRSAGKKKADSKKISPDQAKRALDRELSNIANKVNSGKPLTRAERVTLHQYANSGKGGEGEGESGAPMDYVRTKVELAKALGISRRSLQNHWNDPGRPQARSDGAYDLLKFRQWAVGAGFGKVEDMAIDQLPRKQELEARHLLVKIDIAQLTLAQRRKALIPREDHRAGLKWLVSIFVKALDALPERVGLQGGNEQIVELVENECKRTKDQVRRFIEKG